MLGSGSIEFDNVREYLNQNRDVKRELEFAFTSLLAAANPTDRGTRFAFGGGAEWIMAATAWCAGVLMAPKGHNTNGFDLTDLRNKARGLWSVKASASPKSSDIRLINYMGDGKDNAVETAIGWMPKEGAINTGGLNVSKEQMKEILSVDAEGWKKEIADIRENHYPKFGNRLPKELTEALNTLEKRLG